MSQESWELVNVVRPDEGRIVMTKIENAQGSRNEQPLKWRGSLWYFEDDSMYVYYTPTHWRPLTSAEKTAVIQRLEMSVARASELTAGLIAEIRKEASNG